MKVAVLILNYNGAELLKRYLPSFQRAVAASRHRCELAVVDNASSDESLAALRKEFPGVTVHALKDNRVLCAYNEVVKGVDAEIVLLMNNDIEAEENFIDPLVAPFESACDVFFVTPKVLGPGGDYEGNKTRGFIRWGVFGSTAIYPGYEKETERPGATFQGGFGAFDRKKFLELGGYDDLYLPGRLEDADLCFRAQKRGWKCLYEPRSIVRHEGGVSFHKVYGARRTLVINWRNTFLFMWKNLNDRRIIFSCLFWLPPRLLGSLLLGKTEIISGYLEALPLRREARKRKEASRATEALNVVSEHEIFSRI